jgi:hypothetical protein
MSEDGEEKLENWKQFHGTELGGLMTKIYGNEGRPKINYPKPKQKKPSEVKETFLPCGGKPGAQDPRKSTKRDVKVAVPKLGKKSGSGYSAIDCVPRRRNEDVIRDELDEIAMRRAHYRPAHTKAVSTDAEKDKYSQICTFHGGKGLPEQLTQPVGEAPFEIQAKKKEAERMKNLRSKYRRGGPEPEVRAPTQLSHQETLAQQITEEINERCDHLKEMTELGASARETATIRAEIAQRVADLKKLDS